MRKTTYLENRRPTEDLKAVLGLLGSELQILFQAFSRQMSSLMPKLPLKTGHFVGHVGHFDHQTVQVRLKVLK
jgi:hypothetical protein